MKSTRVISLLLSGLAVVSILVDCAPVSGSNVCKAASYLASKFFVLDELVFFTDNPDSFDKFRAFNLSSGTFTDRYAVSALIPNSALHPKQGPESVLWAFRYDVKVNHCLVNDSASTFDRDNYCTRVSNLKGLVVARLSSRRLVFMRHNMNKLTLAHDQNNFLEINALLKHLDRYGYTSSLTFNQKTDQFVSTHYGLLNQVCVTITRHRGHYVVPLALMEEIISDNLFATECLYTTQSYTSVIDLHGQLYTTTGSGLIHRIRTNSETKQSFETLQSYNDKVFFNCFKNSPVVGVGRYEHEINLILENSNQIELSHNQLSPDDQGVLSRSIDSSDELSNYVHVRDLETEVGGVWRFLWVLLVLGIMGVVGYLCYTGKFDIESCCRVCRGTISGAIKGAKEANDTKNKEDEDDDVDDDKEDEGTNKDKPLKSQFIIEGGKKSKKPSNKAKKDSHNKKPHKDSKPKKRLAQTIGSSGITQTIKSIGQLGKQLGDKIAQWKSNKHSSPTTKQDIAKDSWIGSSESMSSVSDDTENGGVELVSSSFDSGTDLSSSSLTSSKQAFPVGEPRNDGDPLVPRTKDKSDADRSGSMSAPLNSKRSSEVSNTTLPSEFTRNSSSFLSTENELAQSETTLPKSPGHRTCAKTSPKHPPEAMALAQAISSMLDRYRQSKADSSKADNEQRDSDSSSSSPSIPCLLKPGQFADRLKPQSKELDLNEFDVSSIDGDKE